MPLIRKKDIVVAAVIFLGAAFVWVARHKAAPENNVQQFVVPEKKLPRKASSSNSGIATTRAAEFSETEKTDLADKFSKKFKPAVEKWCRAYEGHIPFSTGSFTLDTFHSCLGKNSPNPVNCLYTFIIDGNTLTLRDAEADAKVFYYMTADGARSLNTIPRDGKPPDISVPVTREEVIRMVQADSGVQFKLNECIIKPTGAAGALGGGAFVDMIPTGADPDNGLSSKIAFVFGANGQIVSYQRDPFF